MSDGKSHRFIRQHTKSRRGCFTCKRRKVKCDEGRPVCSACRNRATTCAYPDDGVVTCIGTPSEGRPFPAVRSVREPQACLLATTPSDMRLLWFFTATTSKSFLDESQYRGVTFGETMQTVVVEQAIEHPFLLKTLFALAGQHMRHLGQDVDDRAVIRHRVDAFQSYRAAVEAADPSSLEALVANAILLQVLPSDEFRNPNGQDLYILDWMVLWRGIGCIFRLLGKKPSSNIRELLIRPPIDPDSNEYIPRGLQKMVDDMVLGGADWAQVEVYLNTLSYLGALYKNVSHKIDMTMSMRIITWLTYPSDEFINLARTKEPRALVILAHYTSFLVLLEHVWWIEGIGRRSVNDICRHLDPEWGHVLTVPRRVANANSQSEAVDILLACDD